MTKFFKVVEREILKFSLISNNYYGKILFINENSKNEL